MKYICTILLFMFFLASNLISQNLPVIPVPKGINPVQNIPASPFNQQHNSYNSHINANTDVRARNAALIKEVNEHELKREIQRQSDIVMLTNNGFPLSNEKGTSCYHEAYNEISSMLKGDLPLQLSRSVFLVENAYYENEIKYEDYKQGIDLTVDFCNSIAEYEKLDKDNNIVKNMMIFRFISDTIQIRDKHTKKKIWHYPVKYDYEDYSAKKSYDNHFVTTLMRTRKGQCYSMPLYYLVLAEAMGAEAFWSFSPKHSFVKIQDEQGVWYNLELTCKAILSDAHYMNNSYIKAEALQNRIYLEPLDKTDIIANMLLDLARGYYQKYGYDDFYLKCIDTATQYLTNNVDALILKSAYQTRLTLVLGHLLNAPNPDVMKQKSPEAYKHFELMQAQYKEIDDMGYEELPDDLYARWLDYIEKEKEKSEKLPSIFINLPKER